MASNRNDNIATAGNNNGIAEKSKEIVYISNLFIRVRLTNIFDIEMGGTTCGKGTGCEEGAVPL